MKPAKKQPVKARKLWEDAAALRLFESNIVGVDVGTPTIMTDLRPVFVLPATPEAYEQMVEQGARCIDPLAFQKAEQDPVFKRAKVVTMEYARTRMRNALAAIGIRPRPQSTGGINQTSP